MQFSLDVTEVLYPWIKFFTNSYSPRLKMLSLGSHGRLWRKTGKVKLRIWIPKRFEIQNNPQIQKVFLTTTETGQR